MKIKVLDVNKLNYFAKEDLNCEKTVYAIFKKNRNYYYLINQGNGMPLFIKNNQDIKVIDNHIPEDWIYTKKFIDDYTDPMEAIIYLEDLYCPQWMLENKNFLFEVFLERKLARKKFLRKIKN